MNSKPPTKVVRCLLIGHYGYSNFGDDLFVRVFCDMAAKRDSLHVSVLSTYIEGVDAEFVVPSSVEPTIYSSASLKGRLVRLWYAIVASTQCDVVVWCGGSQFDRTNQGAVKYVVRVISALRGVPRAACGISISTDDLASPAARWFFSGMKAFTVRDRPSLKALEQYFAGNDSRMLRYSGDLAAVFEQDVTPNIVEPYIAFVVGNYPSVTLENLKILCAAVAAVASIYGLSVKVVCLNHGENCGDLDISKQAVTLLEKCAVTNVDIVLQFDLVGKWRSVVDARFVVSMRLHGAVCSYFSSTKFILVEYNKKCGDFLEDIGTCRYQRLYWPSIELEQAIEAMCNCMDHFIVTESAEKYRKNSLFEYNWFLDVILNE